MFKKILLFSFVFFTILLFSCNNDNNIIIEPPMMASEIDIEPSWSPDGRTIAYVHGDTVESLRGIYFIDTSGNNMRKLITGLFYNHPDWSPDGNWIVYQNRGQIFKIKADGDSLTQLTFTGSNYFPSWSDNSDWIAYDSNVDSPNGMHFIWKMKADGSQKVRIGYDSINGETRRPHWSKNNIVHIKYFKGGVGAPEIALMNEEGSFIRRLTYSNTWKSTPKLSSDGNKIVFSKQTSGPFQIWTINSDGSKLRFVTKNGSYADWSPDSEKLVFTNTSPNNGRLWIMNIDGSGKRQLTF